MLTCCEVGGRRGLYGTDFFNRSAYRRQLERLGMTFSRDPFAIFDADGAFRSLDRPPFRADFVTLGIPPRERGVLRSSPGQLVHQVAYYRIADIDAGEVARLTGALATAEAVSAPEPADLVSALSLR